MMMIGIVASLAGTLISGMAQSQQANYQAQIAERNAQVAQNKARYDVQAGAAKAQDADFKAANTMGRVVAAQAAGGLDVNSGSNAQVQSSNSEVERLNTLRISDSSRLQAMSDVNQSQAYQADAEGDRMTASNAMTGAMIGGLSGAIGGFSKAGMSGAQTGLFV